MVDSTFETDLKVYCRVSGNRKPNEAWNRGMREECAELTLVFWVHLRTIFLVESYPICCLPQARLENHNVFFNDLIKVIPAKYYLVNNDQAQDGSWVCSR